MAIYATAGARLYIGPQMDTQDDDFVLGDFEGASPVLTWTEISPTENLGTLGDSNEVINFDAINLGRRQKLKGVADAGTMQVVCGNDTANAGQVAAYAAQAEPGTYAFKVQFNDSSLSGTPSLRYFVAHVMSASETLDTANNVIKFNMTLGVNSNVVRKNRT
jgi:hypothetical protein